MKHFITASSNSRTGPQAASRIHHQSLIGQCETVPLLKRRRGSSLTPALLPPEFMTIDEAAEYWRCSRRKVERKLRDAKIPKFKDGHRTLLRIRDVRDHARKMRQK
jgi:excisionase family DNA binding protein